MPESVLHAPRPIMEMPMPEGEIQIVSLPLTKNIQPSAEGWINERADV